MKEPLHATIATKLNNLGGAEWMFAPRWSVFAEYNFMGFGTQSAAFSGCGGTCSLNAKADVQNVLAGVNYKFNF